MRTLLLFALGFTAACGICCYLPMGVWIFLIVACVLAAFLLLFWRSRRAYVAVVILGVLVGTAWTSGFRFWRLSPLQELHGITAEKTVTLSTYSHQNEYGVVADGEILIQGRTYRVRVYLTQEQALQPGDTLRGRFRFTATADGDGSSGYLRGNGIFLTAREDGAVTVEKGGGEKLRDLPAALRHRFLNIIDESFPADTAAFARALLLGDTTDLDYETDTALKLSGIRHMVAVSGLHIAVFMAVLYFITGRRRWLMAVIGTPVLLLFAAMAEFTPSVTRACLMQLLYLLAMCWDKEYDPPTALGFAMLVMLMKNPMTVTSMSFQLSVGSVAGILLFGERLQIHILDMLGGGMGKGLKARFVRFFVASVAITLSASILITPLLAYDTGAVSLVGVLTNLLTLWCVPIIFCGVAAVGILGGIWKLGAGVIAWVIAYPIRYVLAVAKGLANIPIASVYMQSPVIVAWLALIYGLFGVFLLCKRKHGRRYFCVGMIGLLVALLLSWVQPLTENYRMTVLDVGQGQCILLQSEGKTYMVDCGGDNSKKVADLAAETLLSQGVTKLDGLILSHWDLDHVGAAQYFLQRIPADTLFLPQVFAEKDFSLPENRYQTVNTVRQDICLTFGEAKLWIFAGESAQSSNESSLCVLFQRENCDILITGDRPAEGELALLQKGLPELSVLVAGHHGAASSTSGFFLDAVKPQVVVISVGKENRFGHPAQEVLARLKALGCTVYRTDEMGTIIIRG